jgi:hypothetical protein
MDRGQLRRLQAGEARRRIVTDDARITALEARLATVEAQLKTLLGTSQENGNEQPDIEAYARSLNVDIRAHPDGPVVNERDAATMLGRRPKTLKNWFYGHRPLEAHTLAGQRHYLLADIAQLLGQEGGPR